MSGNCKSLLFLLHRCVAARHVTLSTGIKTRGRMLAGRCGFLQSHQYQKWTSTRTLSLQSLSRLQSALKISQHSLCTKAGGPYEDEYPPLPAYHSDSEPEKKEVYIVQAKGLPWACTAEDLLHFFSECRIRDGVKGIHMTLNHQGMPTGRAFIEMEHEEDVSKALEKHRQYLGPRYVEVYEVTNSDAEAMLNAESVQAPASDGVVRLRGLPFSCTEDDIKRFFSGLEIMEDGVTIVLDHRGRNSGEAYVQFSSQEVADEALQRDRENIGNRYVEVYPSRSTEIRSSWRRAESAPQSGPLSAARRSVPNTQSVYEESVQVPVSDGVVRLRGLPFSCTEDDIMHFFSGLEIMEDGVTIVLDRRGRNSGEAYVQFSSQEVADEALQRDRENIGNRYVEVYPSRSTEIRSSWRRAESAPQSAPLSAARRSVPNTEPAPKTAVLENVQPASHQSSVPPLHYVHMRGLPFQVTGQDVVQFFSPLALSKILIECGPDGTPSGDADVFFTCHQDAVDAMSRDKLHLGERYIELFLNSVPETNKG
ncbi:G-rich sequence factor 1 [Centroberyx affinis]|uniref:G-rich sequence factor 1 n=1 Tax=Centroberyx affinis TaxID=166261 RepID=UPI003A5BD5BF